MTETDSKITHQISEPVDAKKKADSPVSRGPEGAELKDTIIGR